MTDDMTIAIDSEDYVLRRDGEGLQVGRRNGSATFSSSSVSPRRG